LTARAVAALVWVLGLLSIEAQRRCGRILGWWLWRVPTDSARTTRANLAACFPGLTEAERAHLARDSLCHTAMLMAESGAIFRWAPERARALTLTQTGTELIDEALASDRAVLLLVPHFGNWEYLALVFGRYGMTALYDPLRIEALEPFIRRARSRAGARLLPINAGGLRSFFRAIADKRIVALLPDQVPERRSGVYAGFFGQRALTMTFAHRVIRRSDVAVFIAAAKRVNGGFEVIVRPAPGELRDPDPVVSAEAMNLAVERLVREDPAQYQWEYKRFKRQPRGTPDPYARSGTPDPARVRGAAGPSDGAS
jgi:KDO2-lipid IV(A) lauroyltransferase